VDICVVMGGSSVVSSSLQPNQPGVLQVVVVVDLSFVVVFVFDVEVVVVVLSSRHPNQPGVSQVEVCVGFDVVVRLVFVAVV